jgi:succinoglycan biosynthesis protein ExoM
VGGKLRTKGFAATTASSIWRAESCFADAMPFDPAFGASGGEDLDLFLRLEARGCRLVWCAEAVVWETVPAERKTLSYNLMRAYSGAQVYAASVIKNATSPPVKAFDVMARGAIQTVSLLWLPFIMLLGGVRWQQQLITIASGLGKVLWWHKLPLYHIEKPPPNA